MPALSFEPLDASADPRFVRVRDGAASATLAALVPRETSLCARRLAALMTTHTELAIDLTPYDGVLRVPPGVRATLEGAGFVTEPVPRRLEPLTGTVDELAAELRQVLSVAIERAIGGARSVAVFAGGGIDSSVILALAHRLAAERGTTVFPVTLDCGGDGDDRPHLRSLAAHLGIEPEWVPPSSASAFVRSALVADAAPYRWPSGPYERALAEAARRRGAEVVLGGYEGDFIFDGDPRALAGLAKRGELRRAYREARQIVVPWDPPLRERVGEFLLKPLLKPLVPQPLLRTRRRRYAGASYPWAGPVLRTYLDDLADLPECDASTASARWTRFATLPRFAEIAFNRVQAAVATGLRYAEPLMDPAVLELVARVEPLDLLAGGRLRGLFRESVKGLIPESVRLRTDKWEHSPAFAEAVTAAGGLATLRDLAAAPRAADLGLVEPRAFLRRFEELERSPIGGPWTEVWGVLAVEQFLQTR